jgi:hypothetical protein
MVQFGYLRDPVSPREFFTGSEYLGHLNFYPESLETLVKIFDGKHKEATLRGPMGSGKSTIAMAAVARVLYEISCIESPHNVLGLQDANNISVIVLHDLPRVVPGLLDGLISESPYFKANVPIIKRGEMHEIGLPNHVWVVPRTGQDPSSLGFNVIACVDDCSAAYRAGAYPKLIVDSVRNRRSKLPPFPGVLIHIEQSVSEVPGMLVADLPARR